MVNTVGKETFVADRAYLSGFLDGDGAIMATIEKHQEKKFGFRVRIVIKISQKDENALRWFLDTFGVGKIRQNIRSFDWIIKNQTDAKYLIDLMLPYLKAKKKQAEIARSILEVNSDVDSKDQFLAIARLADSLSFLNVRSKNRRTNYTTMIEEVFSRND